MDTSLLQIIRSRRSIRRFLPDPVDREKILTCLEAARLAPSAQNSQPWRYLIVDDPALKDGLAREAFSGIYSMTKFASQAPVLIVILAKLGFMAHRVGPRIQKTQFYLIDIGISAEHFILQAEELGLSTCWVGWFHARRTRRLLKISRKYKIVCLLALGHAASRPPSEAKRKPLEEISWFNRIAE